MPHDLLLRGATVIDPSQELNEVRDVAVDGDRIAAVEPTIDEPATRVLDLPGRILTPGWIDIHAHLYAGSTTWGIKADPHCLSTGVTTIVDAGSSGWANFLGFAEYISAPARTQMLAFLHISGIGLTYGPLGEMADMRYADPERTAFVIDTWSDICVGVKVRQGTAQVEENGVEPLRLAVEAAAMASKPVMCHIGSGGPLSDVMELMRPKDIITHCYHGHNENIIDEGGMVRDEVWQARERGVLFDLGHGGGSFFYNTAKQALAAGFPSDVLSTDIHISSLEDPVWSLPETASKMMNLGLSLTEVVRQSTAAPAAAIGRGGDLGTLKPGTIADLSVFELEEGEFTFTDVRDQVETGSQMLQPVLTVRAGAVYDPADLEEEMEETRRCAQQMKALQGKQFDKLGWSPGGRS